MVNNTTYSVEYTNAVAESNESKTAFWSKVIAEENGLRKLFAQQRDAPELNDPLVHLINPHADESLQLACKQWPEELAIPVVMPVKKRLAERERAIASKDEFLVNFRMFTEGMLFDLNWNNVFMAGGSVLACILPVPAPFNATASARRKYLREKYPASDIDLFIYGLAEDAAKAKMDEIYNSIADNLPHACIAFRTPAAVTIVSRYPYRHVQLVLRLYKSPAEVVMGFDVDACAVGFNGTDVMITRRAHLALVNQVNTIDISRRSPSYELRLSKYSERGFEVRVPQLDRKKVDPQIYERGFDKVNGLARLLLFESLRSMDERMNFKEVLRTRRLRPPHELAGRYSSNNYARQGDLKAQSVDSSDYASLFLPYGEEWNAESIRRQAYKKDKVLNNPFMMKKLRKTRHHQHPCFFGTMKEVFEDCCGQCPALPEDWDPEEDKLFVRGELKFIVDDPGRQEIGSFNPITDGDWTSDAYVHDLAEDVVRAIVADDVEKLKTIIKFPTIVPPEGSPTDPTVFDPNSRDWLGRTPLLLATFCTARRCIEYLLSPESDAKITPTLPDGRTALHLCAEYGLTDIAKLILKRNELNVLRMEEREKEKNAAAEKEKKSKQAENDQDNKDIDEDDYESITKDDISDEEEYHSVSEKDFEDEDAKEEKKKSDPEEVEDDVIDLNWADWDMKMTPLHYACFNGRVEMVTLLIDAGASYFKSVIVKQNLTYTPFNLALLCPFEDRGLDVIKELIKKNVPLTLINQAGENIVHMAVRLARMDIFEELQPMIAKSAALDALNFEAKSPLLIACEMGRVTCVEKLLELGALLMPSQEVIKQALERVKNPPYSSPFYGSGHRAKISDVAQKIVSPIYVALVHGNHQILKILFSELKSGGFNDQHVAPADGIADSEIQRVLSSLTGIYFELNKDKVQRSGSGSGKTGYLDLDTAKRKKVVTLNGALWDYYVNLVKRKEAHLQELPESVQRLLPADIVAGFKLDKVGTVEQRGVEKKSKVERWWDENVDKEADSWDRYAIGRLILESEPERSGQGKSRQKDVVAVTAAEVASNLKIDPEELLDGRFLEGNSPLSATSFRYASSTWRYYSARDADEILRDLKLVEISMKRLEACEELLLQNEYHMSNYEAIRQARDVGRDIVEQRLRLWQKFSEDIPASQAGSQTAKTAFHNGDGDADDNIDDPTSGVSKSFGVTIAGLINVTRRELDKKARADALAAANAKSAKRSAKKEIKKNEETEEFIHPLYQQYTIMYTPPPKENKDKKKAKAPRKTAEEERKEKIALGERYHRLFEAVWAGDTSAVRRLTGHGSGSKGHTTDKLLVYVMGPFNLNLLMLAVLRDDEKMLRELVRISWSQHKSEDEEDLIDEEKPDRAVLNNYTLAHVDLDEDNSDYSDSEGEDIDPDDLLEGKEEIEDPNEQIEKENEDEKRVTFDLPPSCPLTVFNILPVKGRILVQGTVPEKNVEKVLVRAGLYEMKNGEIKTAELQFTVVDLCCVTEKLAMLRCLVEVLRAGEFKYWSEPKAAGDVSRVLTLKKWRIVPQLFHAALWTSRSASICVNGKGCSDIHEQQPVDWIVTVGNKELLTFAIEEGLCGVDLDQYFGVIADKSELEKEKQVSAGGKLDDGSVKPYFGLKLGGAREIYSALDDSKDESEYVDDDGSEERVIGISVSLAHLAATVGSPELIPALLDADLISRCVKTFTTKNSDHPWSTRLLTHADEHNEVVKSLFGGRARKEPPVVRIQGSIKRKIKPPTRPTPLHFAVIANQPEVIAAIGTTVPTKLLDEWVTQFDENGQTPAHVAAGLGHLEALKAVLALPVSAQIYVLKLTDKQRGWTPLHFASYFGRHQTLAYILKCVVEGQLGEVLWMTSRRYAHTPLMLAVIRGKQRCVKHLLTAERRIRNASGVKKDAPFTAKVADVAGLMQPVHIAVRNQHLDVLQELLSAAGDASATTGVSEEHYGRGVEFLPKDEEKLPFIELDLSTEDSSGLTPFTTAAQKLRLGLRDGELGRKVNNAKKPKPAKDNGGPVWVDEAEPTSTKVPVETVYRVMHEKAREFDPAHVGVEMVGGGGVVRAVELPELRRVVQGQEAIAKAAKDYIEFYARNDDPLDPKGFIGTGTHRWTHRNNHK